MGGKLSNGDVSDAQQPADSGAYVVEDEDGRRIIEDPIAESGGTGHEAATADFETAATGNVAVIVSAPGQVERGPIPSDTTATIWAGSYDDSGAAPVGIANESLDVAVTRPDGTTENFSVQTDTSGGASVTYDLSQANRGEGTYDITVTNSNDVSVSTRVDVGTNVVLTSEWGGGNVFVGEESTFAFFAHDGETGVSGLDLTLRVMDNGTTVTEQQTTTDGDGFAKISFTPSQTGGYWIEADRNGSTVASESIEAVEIIGTNEYDLGEALVGTTNAYGGYLFTPTGPLSNTDVIVQIYTDWDQTESNLLTEQTVTTNDGGFFLVEYDLPSDFSENSLYAVAETTDGVSISLDRDFIDVNEPSSGGGGDPDPVQLSGSIPSQEIAPGETATVHIEATDDGTAIAGQPVEVFLRFGYNGPPIYSTTVTTGSDGTVSASVALPDDAPDGFDLRGTVAMDYTGTTYTNGLRSEIKQYNINFNYPTLTPGGTATYRIEVTDVASGNPAKGVPFQFDAVYADGRAGSFGTGKLVSGSDGTDETTVSAPADLGFDAIANGMHRYADENYGFGNRVMLPGNLSTDDALFAGESAEFTFSVQNDVTLAGLAFAQTGYPDQKPFGTLIDGSGSFSLTIPPEASSGDYIEFTVWAVDGSGNRYADSNYVEIQGGTLSISASAEKNVPQGGNANVSISANQIEEISVEKLWTDWSLANTAAGGATVADQVASAGKVDLQYGSAQSSASPSLTLSLPERYVGGKYSLLVSGTDPDGKTVDTTATLTIE